MADYSTLDLKGLSLNKPHANIDKAWGPYSSLSAALDTNTGIDTELRVKGFKFGVDDNTNNSVKEYIFVDNSGTYKEVALVKEDLNIGSDADDISYTRQGDSSISTVKDALDADKEELNDLEREVVKVDPDVEGNNTQFLRCGGVNDPEWDNIIGDDILVDVTNLDSFNEEHNSKNLQQIVEKTDELLKGSVNVNVNSSTKTFAIKTSNNTTVGTIVVGEGAGGSATLTLNSSSNTGQPIVVTLPNLKYDSSRQVLQYVNALGQSVDTVRLSNLQIKKVLASAPLVDQEPPATADFTLGDLILVGPDANDNNSYELNVCTKADSDGQTGTEYLWAPLGKITDVSLVADQVKFSESGFEATNVKAAILEVKDDIEDVIGTGLKYEPITTTWTRGGTNASGEFISSNGSARSGFIQCNTTLRIQCGEGYFIKVVRKYASASDSSTNEVIFSSSTGSTYLDYDITKKDVKIDCVAGSYYVILIGKYNNGSVVDYSSNDENPVALISEASSDAPTLQGTIVEEILTLQSEVNGAADSVKEGDNGLVKNSGVFNAFNDFLFNPFESYIFKPLSTEKVEMNYSILKETDKFGVDDNTKHCAIAVNEGEYYLIKRSGTATVYCFATTDSVSSGGDIPYVTGTDCMIVGNSGKELVCIPQGCNYLLVYDGGNARVYAVSKMLDKAVSGGGVTQRVVKPLMMFGALNTYDNTLTFGDFMTGGTPITDAFENGTYCVTPRFIKTAKDFSIKVNFTGTIDIFYYSDTYACLKVTEIEYTTAGVEVDVTESSDYSFVKIQFISETAYQKPIVELNGLFADDWDTFNIKPTNGNHRIGVMVDVSYPTCCDNISGTIQDNKNLLPNYGVIMLPETYKNTGEATRMIIYCHGAGTHFTNVSSSFDTSKHVDPTYWLKEGYAVMDIDGNPMDGNLHAFRPQTMSAYVAAYQWAIEHYNLKRDGVLLGGRSMGAGNVMNLLRSTCPIPIIAACANHPTSVAMGTTPADKLLIANIRGFILPTGFTFSNGPMNDNDTQVFYDNWDKATRYTPSLALCVDVPTDETWRKNFIKNCCHVGSPYEANRITACQGLHMVVKAPLKMFACRQDPNNGYQATSELYMTMLANAGQYAELRLFDSNKNSNYPNDERDAHYYELADPTLRTTVTTIYGEQVTNVPIVYIEMLQFWRRFEQRL